MGGESAADYRIMLASDHDLIRDEHTLEIYHHISNSQLCIFPDATHMIPYDEPAHWWGLLAVSRIIPATFKSRLRK